MESLVKAIGNTAYTFSHKSSIKQLFYRGIVFADYGKKWKNARTALLGILSPKSVEGFDQTLQHEAERCVNQLIKETQRHGEVNPLEFARCSSISVILSIAFGIPGIKSPDDPFFKELVHIIEMQLYYASVLGDISAYLPILSFLDVIFRKEAKMRKFANNEVFPLFRKLIQSARESNQDSLVKKLDLIKDELEIDERNVMVIMGKCSA
jgi:cytochrome P450